MTEDSIVYYSPLHPLGITYKYIDIEEIKTGFGDKIFSLMEYERKGSFYYQIKVDGKTITIHVPSPNDDVQRYMEDSYLELEEFDKALVDIGVPKTASDKNYDKCDLDKQYVDRFLRIVGNSKAKEVRYADTNT
ncbi:MAG: hypothetical protein IJB96_03285 [Lachnospira sp.]|nr:hypothetical protein [Lachnospira sp.]